MSTCDVRRSIAFGFALLILLPAMAPAQSDTRVSLQFRASLAPSADGAARSRISGDVVNESPYRVTNVRVEIEGVNADNGSVGHTFAWTVGDIAPGGKTYFMTEPIRGASSYRVRVVSWDLVSRGQAP
jgi:hypothetical protein